MRLPARAQSTAATLAASVAGALLYRLVVTGAVTLDLGIGRRTRPLGPLTVTIDADREVVFDLIAAPYLGRAPREVAEHIEVLERASDMVVAAHHTPVPGGLVATTVESVRFERPHTISFRLLRGPVPHVTEQFHLDETGDGTQLRYEGELGTDLWHAGQAWGEIVAKTWIATVERSLANVRERAELKAAAQRRRE